MAFGALARSKKWMDVAAEVNENAMTPARFEITDNFIASCGLEALEKIQFIVAPRKIAELPFVEIETALAAYLSPRTKLRITERTKFCNIKQRTDESIMEFVTRLRKAVQFCKFDETVTTLQKKWFWWL